MKTFGPSSLANTRNSRWKSVLFVVGVSLWIVLVDNLIGTVRDGAPASVLTEFLKWTNAAVAIGMVFWWAWRRERSQSTGKEEVSMQEEGASRYELVARGTMDAIFDWDLQSQKLWWGPGLNNPFGDPQEHQVTSAASWSQRIHPEDREKFDNGVRNIVNGGSDMWREEFRLLCSESRPAAFVYARGHLVRDAHGRPTRLLGSLHDITARRECEEELRRSRRQLRAFSARLESLREEERKRIARELHDTLGQILTGLKLNLAWSKKHLGSKPAGAGGRSVGDALNEAVALADSAIQTVQTIATELRPGVLDNLGLAAAIEQEAQRLHERTGIQCQVDVPETVPALSLETAVGLFRILQEALTNIVRHAKASEVQIRLWLNPEDELVHLEIRDNGVGISEASLANPRSLGLLGMRERAALLGGNADIRPGTNVGTVVSVQVLSQPCPKEYVD